MLPGQVNLLPTAVSAILSVGLGQPAQVPAIILGTVGNNWLTAVPAGAAQLQLALIPQATVRAAAVIGPTATSTPQPRALPVAMPSGARPGG